MAHHNVRQKKQNIEQRVNRVISALPYINLTRKFYKFCSLILLSIASLLGIIGILAAENERIGMTLLVLSVLAVLYFGYRSTLSICDKEEGFTKRNEK
jgi:hypothetical protein